ncbi:hypothetical protein [Corynebacterium kroppenstedtii]
MVGKYGVFSVEVSGLSLGFLLALVGSPGYHAKHWDTSVFMSFQVGLALGEGRALVTDGDEVGGLVLLVAVGGPFGVAVT